MARKVQNPDFSVKDVLAWARTKPADEGYDYTDKRNCALGQFLKETGRAENPRVGADLWQAATDKPWRSIPIDLADALNDADETFGDLADCLAEIEGASA